jgi:hypothetical protein
MPENLALYEVQKPFVEPLLRWCRLWNTALDGLFYDVGLLSVALLARGAVVDTEVPANSNWSQHRFAMLDLTAQSNPSGSIIVVDANLAPYVSKPFLDMKAFFDFANGSENAGLHTLTVTGVGSSAFGSVAFAWDVPKLSANLSPPSCRDMALPMSSRRCLEVGSASRCTMPSKASPRNPCQLRAYSCHDGKGSRTQHARARNRIHRCTSISSR